MIQVPIDLLVFILGIITAGLGSFFTVAIHILLRIQATQSRIEVAQGLQALEIKNLQREHV